MRCCWERLAFQFAPDPVLMRQYILQVNVWKMADCWKDAKEWESSGKEPCKKGNITSATNVEDDTAYGDQQVGRCKACKGLHRKGECPVFKGGYHPGESRDED